MKTTGKSVFTIILLCIFKIIHFARGLGKPEDFLVRNLQGAENVVSYSGYFLVNKEYNSNIFFWFFPAQFNPEKAPLLIWLQGGPGVSSLFGLFAQHGPFYIDKNKKLNIRKANSWTLTHSVIYIDNPVGTGFSYTDNENGYARNQDEITNDLYNALIQFYGVFTKYRAQELYITGESYAGKHVPALAYKIHLENQNFGQRKINLKGIAIGNGFADPYNLVGSYGKAWYSFGLIDENELRYFEEKQDLIKFYIIEQRWGEANDVFERLFIYFESVTGITNPYNVLIASNTSQPELEYHIPYLNKSSVRQALHVRKNNYEEMNLKVFTFLRIDFMKSVKQIYEKLLDTPEKYRILLFSGQLDLVVPYISTENMISKMYWSGKIKYLQAKKTIWRAGGQEVLGYSKRSRNLRLLLIRNAGHFASFDQPEVLFKMINTFTSGKAFLS